MTDNPEQATNRRRSAVLWLIAAAFVGVALALLFPDSSQQDGGYHFLFARWAWTHTELFVGVWARPLFTTLYAFPALHSYAAAKIFTVLICVLTARQTQQLAAELKIDRSALVIPLLYLQPSFFIISADTMTEPIFALVLILALRLHLSGRIRAGMVAASLMILARPEGFFLGLLWGVWVLADRRAGFCVITRALNAMLLATGAVMWWLAAWAITGDPLFIKNNWPAGWPVTGTIYGEGAWWSYFARLPEIVGPLLILPFAAGLWSFLRRRRHGEIISIFVVFFLLHSILRAYGLLGSAGYPRYFAAVAPVIAILTLEGWNLFAGAFKSLGERFGKVLSAAILAVSFGLCFAYFDGAEWIRDVRAVDEMHAWFRDNPRPVRRLVWSQAYMCIRFDADPWENLSFSGDRERDIESLRTSLPGTLVVWEKLYGPKSHGLQPEDFDSAGYRLLYSKEFELRGYLLRRSYFGFGGTRRQEMYLYYKD
ncbi:MAG: hypothetical protein KF868_04240 [Acidobacteria bacterium]|nr:hypothetical protein [Acidobacteriota bacterium]